MTSFGFIILSHRDPDQLVRLVATLNALYGDPPIACHHDQSQSQIDPRAFPANVRFVDPSIRTGWARMSVVDATLLALDLLYTIDDPDYCIFLTGADYPVATPEVVARDLAGSGADAFIDGYALDVPGGESEPHEAFFANFRTAKNANIGRERYLDAQVRIPVIRRGNVGNSTSVGRAVRLGAETVSLSFRTPFSPFGPNYHCFHGSQQFTLGRKAATKVLNPTARDRRLKRYLTPRVAPEECYFQTVLRNNPNIRCDPRTARFIDWSGGGSHPALIAERHLAALDQPWVHFARKFVPDDAILDAIDQRLGLGRR